MAADLLENFQYGLSSSGLSGADKTVLLLKLTDPSLKCIEQYQKLKYSSSKKPSIQFTGNSGIITFPSSDAKDGEREFKFTVQPIQAPPTSSFESIRQYTNSRGEQKLNSLGSIQTKVTVSGTDDVYQTTHQKMKLADEEMKKVSTKEVKQNQFKPGHRVKRKSISAHAKKIMSSTATSASNSSSSTSHSTVSSNSTLYSSLSSSSINTSTAMSSSSSTTASRSLHSSSSSSSLAASKSAISGSSSSKSSGAKTSSSGSSTKPVSSSSAPSIKKSAVQNRSYRDRVIHILALRPFKKPELLAKLLQDGISSKEKNQLAIILPQVASLAKDNTYVLNKNLYNEVTLDWPAYSDEDKQFIKRKKADLCPKGSPSPPPQRSPHHSSAPPALGVKNSPTTHAKAKTSSPASQKRPLLPEVKDFTKTKKPRIAHSAPKDSQSQLSPNGGFAPPASNSKKAPSPGTASNAKKVPSPSGGFAPPAPSINKKVPSPVGLFKKVPSPSSNNAPSSVPSPSSTQQSALSSPSVSTTRNSPDCCDSANSMTTATSGSKQNGRDSITKTSSGKGEKMSKGGKEEKRQAGKDSPSGDVSSTSMVPEYMLKYTTIRSMEQRTKYKEEFNDLYPKYHEHHKYIEGIKHKFKDLQKELNDTPKQSKNYEILQDRVIEEYAKITQNPVYKEKEARWREYHDLLGHIKNLIMVYDNERLQLDTA